MTGFSDAQIRLLAGKLQEKHIRTREHHGVTLSYIEGWHAIDEANRDPVVHTWTYKIDQAA